MSDYRFDHDWFTPNVEQWACFLLPLAGTPCQLLEIGTYQGRSAFWVAREVMTHPDSRIICVDSWCIDEAYGMKGRDVFDRNLEKCPNRDQFTVLSGDSAEILPTLKHRSFDFAYIDGSHEARDIITDWVNVLRLMKPGGIVCFDDYEWGDDGNTVRILPKPAIDSILEFWSDRIDVLRKGYQVWVKV